MAIKIDTKKINDAAATLLEKVRTDNWLRTYYEDLYIVRAVATGYSAQVQHKTRRVSQFYPNGRFSHVVDETFYRISIVETKKVQGYRRPVRIIDYSMKKNAFDALTVGEMATLIEAALVAVNNEQGEGE